MSDRELVSTDAPWARSVGYSRAVRVGEAVYVSGTIAVREDGEIGPLGDAESQARRCLEIIAAALEEAGASLADVVRTRMYVTNVHDWEAVGRAHGAAFADVRPATTLVEVAGLIDPEALVEIEAMAIRGSG